MSSKTERIELYGGDVVLEFNPANHRYSVTDGGRTFRPSSVTGICGIIDKPALVPWAVKKANEVWLTAIKPGETYNEIFLETLAKVAAKAHREIKEEAGQIGREIHQALETQFKTGHPVDVAGRSDERVRNGINAALTWLGEHRVEALEIERRVYSRRLRVSGTLDKLALVDGEIALLDWKSSNAIWDEMWLQQAAYAKFYTEETGTPVVRRYLIHLHKDTGEVTPHIKRSKASLEKDYRAFRAAVTLSNRMKELRRKSGG